MRIIKTGQGHDVSKCWWKSVPVRLAHHGAAANLQFAKNTHEQSAVRRGRPVSPHPPGSGL